MEDRGLKNGHNICFIKETAEEAMKRESMNYKENG